MDVLISDLVGRYERGKLSRRDLVAGLAALAAVGTGGAPAAAQGAAPAPITPTNIDHVSMLVSDLQASVDFYGRVFGLQNVSEDVEHKIVRMAPAGADGGASDIGGAIISLRQEPPVGEVDHFAFKVPGMDRPALTEALTAHGLTPATTLEYGFYIQDPDGFRIQFV